MNTKRLSFHEFKHYISTKVYYLSNQLANEIFLCLFDQNSINFETFLASAKGIFSVLLWKQQDQISDEEFNVLYYEWLKSNKIQLNLRNLFKLTKHPKFCRDYIIEMIYDQIGHQNTEKIVEDILLILEKEYIKYLTKQPTIGYDIYNQEIVTLSQEQCKLMLQLRNIFDCGNKGYLVGTDLILLYVSFNQINQIEQSQTNIHQGFLTFKQDVLKQKSQLFPRQFYNFLLYNGYSNKEMLLLLIKKGLEVISIIQSQFQTKDLLLYSVQKSFLEKRSYNQQNSGQLHLKKHLNLLELNFYWKIISTNIGEVLVNYENWFDEHFEAIIQNQILSQFMHEYDQKFLQERGVKFDIELIQSFAKNYCETQNKLLQVLAQITKQKLNNQPLQIVQSKPRTARFWKRSQTMAFSTDESQDDLKTIRSVKYNYINPIEQAYQDLPLQQQQYTLQERHKQKINIEQNQGCLDGKHQIQSFSNAEFLFLNEKNILQNRKQIKNDNLSKENTFIFEQKSQDKIQIKFAENNKNNRNILKTHFSKKKQSMQKHKKFKKLSKTKAQIPLQIQNKQRIRQMLFKRKRLNSRSRRAISKSFQQHYQPDDTTTLSKNNSSFSDSQNQNLQSQNQENKQKAAKPNKQQKKKHFNKNNYSEFQTQDNNQITFRNTTCQTKSSYIKIPSKFKRSKQKKKKYRKRRSNSFYVQRNTVQQLIPGRIRSNTSKKNINRKSINYMNKKQYTRSKTPRIETYKKVMKRLRNIKTYKPCQKLNRNQSFRH